MLYSVRQDKSGMVAVRKEIEALGWYTPAEMSTLDFCPADAELLPVVCSGKEFYNNNNKGEFNED